MLSWMNIRIGYWPRSSRIFCTCWNRKHQYPLKPDDDSVQIHVCHSSLRQLEVLKEQMIHWLAQGTEDAPRQPSDILVLAPNLKELEPAIQVSLHHHREKGRQ